MFPKALLPLVGLASYAFAEDNGFQRTPVMGFNTYNAVSCYLNQTWVNETMLAFSQRGFRELGYKFFQLDCGWQAEQRQQNGSLTYNETAFPDGIRPLSKQAISLGFEWGMYTSEGTTACSSVYPPPPGSEYYEMEDALQFAGWNTAYVKVDNCGTPSTQFAETTYPQRFGNMSRALNAVGILGMLVCQWGSPYQTPDGSLQGPSVWTPPLATSYRVSDDSHEGWSSVFRILNQAISVSTAGQTGPGDFADMDLLQVGNPGMTLTQQASHFAIWSMFKSALMVSTDVINMSDETFDILSNKDLIAIDQDPLGMPVRLVQRFTDQYDLYAGPLSNGDVAVLLVDMSGKGGTLSVNFQAVNVTSAVAKNLWTGVTTNQAVKNMSMKVEPYGSLPLRLTEVKPYTPAAVNLNWIEADTGVLTGDAQIVSCPGCYNGEKVGYLGPNSSIILNNIITSQSTQAVRFDYPNCDYSYYGHGENVRGAGISVNGGEPQPVLFPLTGYNWAYNVSHNFLVELSGFKTDGSQNSITIAPLWTNGTYGPDISRVGFLP